MLTDQNRTNIHARRIMGYTSFKTQFLSFLEESIRRIIKAMSTGPTGDADVGGWYQKVTMEDGAGSNTITLGDMYGADGQGNLISVDSADGRITDVVFQNTGAVTYYVGVSTVEIPVNISQDTTLGTAYYDHHLMSIGHSAAPSAVSDTGTGLQFTLANHVDAGNDFTSRAAYVFLNTPASPNASTAIVTGTISSNTLTITGYLGQDTPSTTAGDYTVIVTGPRISRADISSTAGVAFIGTVVGGSTPRTYDVSGQVLINTLASITTALDSVIDRGWISYPAATTGASTYTITATGLAYMDGRVYTTPTSSALSFGASAESWVYFDTTDATFKVTTTWTTAFASTALPLQYVVTDGSSNISYTGRAYRSVAKFNKPLTFTLTSDTTYYPGAFSSLKDALTAARSAYLLASAGSSPSLVIEVIGPVLVTAQINQAELLEIPNLTFVGRANSGGNPFATSDNDVVSRIVWSFGTTTALFANDTSDMFNWTFRDIHFTPVAVASSSGGSIFRVGTGGNMYGIVFERCTFDGINLYSATAGRFAHVLYCNGNSSVSGLTFDDCTFVVADPIVYFSAAGGGSLTSLRMLKCNIADVGASPVSAVAGSGILLLSTSTHGTFQMLHNIYSASAPFLYCDGRLSSVDFSHNMVEGSTTGSDTPMIKAGASGTTEISDTIIADNRLIMKSTGTPASAVIKLYISDSNTGGTNGIFIHDNFIRSEVDTAGDGINIDGNANNSVGLQIHNNQISFVQDGIVLSNGIRGAMISNNTMFVGDRGIALDTNVVKSVISGNMIIVDNSATGPAIDADSTCTNLVLVGNVIDEDVAGALAHITLAGADCIVVGCFVTDDINVAGDSVVASNIVDALVPSASGCVFTGNYVGAATDIAANDTVVTGNHFAAAFTTNSANNQTAATGNFFNAAVTLSSDRGAFAGNHCNSTTTLAASSSDWAVGSNRFDSTFTDSGTGNTSSGANDT